LVVGKLSHAAPVGSSEQLFETDPSAVSARGKELLAQEFKIGGADLKLGVASYSFRKFSRAQAIQMTKELGTPYLNVKDFHLALNSTPADIDQAQKEFADAGIILVGCGNVSFSKDDEADIRPKFEYAKRAGFPLIVAAPTHETLPKLEKFVKEYDIRLAIHNHGPEDKLWHSPLDVLKGVQKYDSRIGCCIDIGHTVRAGVDVVKAIHEVGPRLYNMHAKDLTSFTSKESQVSVGDGILPIREIFQALIATNYKGFVDLEYEVHGDDPMPGAMASFAYMRGVLAGMGYLSHS